MSPKEEPVAIETLDASQLSKLKDSVAQEVERLASSSIQLQRASGAFENRGRAISSLADTKEGHRVLLPLTESLYVSGSVVDTKHVKVDIGTNYYVEMTTEGGQQYCERKVDKLRTELESLAKVIKNKQNALQQINLVLQQKLMAQQSQASKKP